MTEPAVGHPDAHEIAGYVDGALAAEARATIDAHLATCADCRSEVAEVSRILRTAPARRRVSRRVWIPAAAAAALALYWVAPRALREYGQPQHRDDVVTPTFAPRVIAPVGPVERVSGLIWSSVPGGDRYRVRLFDADGTVLWERELTDTAAAIPDSIVLRPREPYYWRVEAHSGFDRRAESELAEFRIGARTP
jgi:hypothetical protein